MIPVIDLSQWQGAVDFKLMAARGVKAVIVRAGNGDAFDLKYGVYVFAAHAAGLKVGSYWFLNPKVGTAAAAGRLLAQVHNDWHLELPPMLDIESYAKERGTLPALTGAAYFKWIRTMADTVERTARRPIVYSNAAYWNPWIAGFDTNDTAAVRAAKTAEALANRNFGSYDLICARYPYYGPVDCALHVPPLDSVKWAEWIFASTTKRPQLPVGWGSWAGWQFSAGYNQRGAAYGCSSTDLDLNIIRDDVYARWTGTPAPPPVPPVHQSVPQKDETPMYVTLTSTKNPADTRPERVMAFDGSGWSLLPPGDNESMKSMRVAYGDNPQDANVLAWAPFMDVAPDVYDSIVAGANGVRVTASGELVSSSDVVKVEIVSQPTTTTTSS